MAAMGQKENWLLGALLTEVAAACHTLAAVLLRSASTRGHPGKPPFAAGSPASLDKLLCCNAFWASLCLRGAACYVWWRARCNAPDTTVEPLFVMVSFIVNMAGGPALLHEQYRSREVAVALGCIVAVLMASTADRYIMDPWPSLTTCIIDMKHLDRGQGSALLGCGLLWISVVIACLVRLGKARQSHDRPPSLKAGGERSNKADGTGGERGRVALPVLAGLMSGANYFVGYVGFPFCLGFDDGDPRVDTQQGKIIWGIAVFVLGFFSLLLAIEGARRFDCRYFVPASTTVGFFTATVMRVLLSRHWFHAPAIVVVLFFVAHGSLLFGPFLSNSEPAVIKLPRTLKKEEDSLQPETWMPEFSNPFKHGTVDPLPLVATPLLEFGEEVEGWDMPDPDHETPLLCLRPPWHPGLRWLFRKWVAIASVMPILVLIVPLAFLTVAVGCSDDLQRILVVASYTAWAVGATGLRIAVFSSVGRLRIRLCTATDYPELCKTGHKPGTAKKPRKSAGGGKLMLISDPFDTPGSSSSEDDDNLWQSVHHIVVVEGACDPQRGFLKEELRGLLHSIERSPLAATNVAVLIAVGDAESRAAVAALQEEFAHTICWSLPPRGTLRASPSGHLYDFGKQTFAKSGFRSRMALVTYTTADAVFHHGYFSALTFAFLSSGEMRSTIIWQPPVLTVKDYTAQSAAVRHASLFLSQHQLASLTDPMAVPLPGSTCSVPLSLLRAIEGCWEPDCPATLPNAGIWTKCWLTTIGRSSVKPIFLPVLRSSMSGGEDLGSWAQMQRYTRGLVEIMYFWSALPLALFNGSSVGCNRLLCLFLRSLPPLLSITWSHMALSTWFIAMSSNWIVLLYGWRYWPESYVDSGPFLFTATAALFGVGILPMLVITHVALIEQLPLQTLLPPSAQGDGPAASRRFRRPVLHALELLLTGIFAGPALFCMTFLTEWRMGCRLTSERGGSPQEAESLGPPASAGERRAALGGRARKALRLQAGLARASGRAQRNTV